MNLFNRYCLAIVCTCLGVGFSAGSSLAQPAATEKVATDTNIISYKIGTIFRDTTQRFISDDGSAGFIFRFICTGPEERGVLMKRLYLLSGGAMGTTSLNEDFLAWGYTKDARECADLRDVLYKMQPTDLATVEFRDYTNSQIPIPWYSRETAPHQIVVNGRVFNIYRYGSFNPFN